MVYPRNVGVRESPCSVWWRSIGNKCDTETLHPQMSSLVLK